MISETKAMATTREAGADSGAGGFDAQFWAMHMASREEPPVSLPERKEQLRALRRAISGTIGELQEAIARDYGGRSREETLMAEIIPALTTVRDALRNVGRWMRPERRGTSIMFWPGRNQIVWQPKGVVLILSPWQYQA